jgi:RsiW-degrading membrane proteinase PrsW (M82 family)
MDLYEREPLILLLGAFIYGAIPSILFSLLMFNSETSLLQIVIIEEVTKLFLVLVYMIVHQDEVDNWIDAALYGSMVGLGFGFSENLVYLFMSDSLVTTFFIRCIIFGFMHPLWCIISSTGVGTRRTLPIISGLALSICLHYGHNLLALSNSPILTIVLYASVSISILLLITVGWNYQKRVLSNYLEKVKCKYISNLILDSKDEELLHIAMEGAQGYIEGNHEKSNEYLEKLNKLLDSKYGI